MSDGRFVDCARCFESLTDCLSPATAAHSIFTILYYVITYRVDPASPIFSEPFKQFLLQFIISMTMTTNADLLYSR